MIERLKRALASLQDFVWPQKVGCLLCDEFSRGEWLCPACAGELERLRMGCQTEDVRSAYIYNGCARQLIHALKYDALYPAAEVMADAMAETIREMNLPEDTVLTWVTTTRMRQLSRGGDHGRALCQAVADRVELPMRQLLIRTRSARTQRGLNARERQTNLRGVFCCREELSVPVLIVDDVHTTGATLQACTEALREAGSPAVYAVTATRVQNGEDPEDEIEMITKGG